MILGLLGNLPVILEIIKTYIAEWVAIIRKRPLYKHIKWTKEQQKSLMNTEKRIMVKRFQTVGINYMKHQMVFTEQIICLK